MNEDAVSAGSVQSPLFYVNIPPLLTSILYMAVYVSLYLGWLFYEG